MNKASADLKNQWMLKLKNKGSLWKRVISWILTRKTHHTEIFHHLALNIIKEQNKQNESVYWFKSIVRPLLPLVIVWCVNTRLDILDILSPVLFPFNQVKAYLEVKPGSDAVLHMSRIEFNEWSSCEVRRLNQFRTANLIQIGSAIFSAWLSREQRL